MTDDKKIKKDYNPECYEVNLSNECLPEKKFDDKIFLVPEKVLRQKYRDEEGWFTIDDEIIDRIIRNSKQLTPELEEKILLEVLNKWGTGTEEGYIDKITHEVFQKLKESVK